MYRHKYLCSAVVNGRHESKEILAYSSKQAELFFKKYYGYRVFDFKALLIADNTVGQIKLNI